MDIKLSVESVDHPVSMRYTSHGAGSGAEQLFGATGGVMEAAVRRKFRCPGAVHGWRIRRK